MEGAERIRIGTSGWQYRHWKGVLYPEDAPARAWFSFYAARFDTVEINATFYHLPEESTFHSWAERAPGGFLYALKFSRYGTHLKRLLEPADTIGLFLERARRLGPSLGPVLVQIPPRFHADPGRLDAFLEAGPAGVPWAVEFRDPDWLRQEVYAVLARHGAALVLHDHMPHPRRRTAPWTYRRYHGKVPGGCYSRERLAREAEDIAGEAREGMPVYAYFNNDTHGHAVRNALELRRMVLGC
ncbi:MAG TPA: DUF72 domain-containing protein [Candidatus Polarisedimenticolia bacterium]|nr:DUF72 domain-containing protein [Candidatus Polarisedimenticolia bacterium]